MSFESCWEWDQQKAEHKLTWSDVIYLIGKETTYHHAPISTLVPLVPAGANVWPAQKDAPSRIRVMYNKMIPYHFAYIKFYTTKEGYGPFALVAGKTNLGAPDFYFDLSEIEEDERPLEEILADTKRRANKAKQFLLKTHGDWYCQGVLAVWEDGQKLEGQEDEDGIKVEERDGRLSSPETRRAKDVEANIRSRLKLFSS